MKFHSGSGSAIPIDVLGPGDVESYTSGLAAALSAQPAVKAFKAGTGDVAVVLSGDGGVDRVLAGRGSASERARKWHAFGPVRGKLPDGVYDLRSGLVGDELEQAALAWLLSGYRFGRYKDKPGPGANLLPPAGVDAARTEVIAEGVALCCDLINTPASDLGPAELQQAVEDLGQRFGASVTSIVGDDLLANNFPMIHAVGRAAARAPRLVDLSWGDPGHMAVTLVGKGVCFDTGGLNLKPGGSMGLMKKDMGGAATVLGLAHMIMALGLPVRLRVLIPAVENSVSGASFRPGDVLRSRKGLTVEINNTDAEGRLVLADALALADETPPDLMVCMATLTGAARVALGPDLPPYFTDDDDLAARLDQAATRVIDPLWRMPFWPAYDQMIEPEIADLDNAPSGGFAGAITAALFLRRFVDAAPSFVHFDCYGWTPAAKPGRPKGGACQGARALLEVIEARAKAQS